MFVLRVTRQDVPVHSHYSRRRILGLVIEKEYNQPLGAALSLPSSYSYTLLGFGLLASSSNQLIGGPNTQIFMRDLV